MPDRAAAHLTDLPESDLPVWRRSRAGYAWLAAAVSIPLLLVMLVVWTDRQAAERNGIAVAERTAALLHEHATRTFEAHALILSRVEDAAAGMTEAEIAASAPLQRLMKRLADESDLVEGIGIIGSDGHSLLASQQFPSPRIDLSDREYFQVHSRGDVGYFVTALTRGRLSGALQFGVSKRRVDAAGGFAGIVSISVPADYFSRYFLQASFSPDDSATLFRSDGVMLIRRDMTGMTESLRLDGVSPFMRAIAASPGAGHFVSTAVSDGVERFYSYRKVAGWPLYVTFGLATHSVYGPWREAAWRYAALGGGGAAAMLLLGVMALRRADRERLALARLALSEARFRAYFEHAAEGLFIVRVLPEGGFVYEAFNRADERITGLSQARDAGKGPADVLPAATAARVLEYYRRCVETGEPQHVVHDIELPAGRRALEVTLLPVRDAAGRIVRLIGSSRDITRRRALEEQLRQAQKMEALGQLTGGVAHDFNNLLTAVLGNLELARARITDARTERLVGGAQRAAERGAALTQRLLAFARKQHLAMRPVDVNALVGQLDDMLARALGGHVQVRKRLAPDLWATRSDPNQIEAALLNLAINARDAMPGGGRLTIATRNAEVGHDEVRGLPAGRYVVLEVADTGEGMPPEVLVRAFDPFFTTKGAGKGSGLGLSMVLGFAQQSDGTVTIDSAAGTGTTVRMWLPWTDERAAPPEDEPVPTATEVSQGDERLVLLVDDDPDVLEITAASLQELGYRVLTAPSGAAALAEIASGARIDIMVADYAMPGITGAELARSVRLHLPQLPILIITGYADRAAQAAADLDVLWINKPFRQAELAASLAAIAGARVPVAG